MIFIYKHYEKIILSVFLIIFIVSLVWLITVFQKAKDIKKEDIFYEPLKSGEYKYKKQNLNEFYFFESGLQVDSAFSRLWHISPKRNVNSPDYTDLMIPFITIRSPISGKSYPKANYDFQKDKETGTEIGRLIDKDFEKFGVEIKTSISRIDTEDKITNDSGISNEELKNNKVTLETLECDNDNDGFSNRCEINKKTDPNDPKSHPPLIERCIVDKIERRKIPLKIINVLESGTVQAEIIVNNQRKTKWLKVNDVIEVNKDLYKVKEIKYKISEKIDSRIKDSVQFNDSEVLLVKDEEIPIIAKIKKEIFEVNEKVVVKDLFNDLTYLSGKGFKLVLGDDKIGVEEYKVIEIDVVNKQITISDKDKKNFIIRNKSEYVKPSNIFKQKSLILE